MDAKPPLYVYCQNGGFSLPDSVVQSLASQSPNGCVYLRQDEDVLTISATRIIGGHRRALNARFRAPMFRLATRLGIVDLHESVRVMGVEWRKARRVRA
jgi:hypothetical protein